MSKAKKSKRVVIKTVAKALKVAKANREAKRVLTLNKSMKSKGKELGKALIALRKKLGATKGCNGWFSKFLEAKNINRRTAYYAIDAASGKKRKTSKQSSRKSSPYQQFKETLKGKKTQQVRETLVQLWDSLNLNAGPLIPKAKQVEATTASKIANTPAGKWMSKIDNMPPDVAKGLLKSLDHILEVGSKKKPAASVRKESHVQPAATA